MKETGKIRILGLIQEGSGTRYHRVELPLSHLNGKIVMIDEVSHELEVEFETCEKGNYVLTEEHFKKYDIIYTTWILHNYVSDLTNWKEKYNCKWIQDFDDGIPAPNNPTYKNQPGIRSYIRDWMIKSVSCADAVVTSSPHLASEFLKLNPFVQISYNFLPYGQGQFVKK